MGNWKDRQQVVIDCLEKNTGQFILKTGAEYQMR